MIWLAKLVWKPRSERLPSHLSRLEMVPFFQVSRPVDRILALSFHILCLELDLLVERAGTWTLTPWVGLSWSENVRHVVKQGFAVLLPSLSGHFGSLRHYGRMAVEVGDFVTHRLQTGDPTGHGTFPLWFHQSPSVFGRKVAGLLYRRSVAGLNFFGARGF